MPKKWFQVLLVSAALKIKESVFQAEIPNIFELPNLRNVMGCCCFTIFQFH